MKEAGKSIFRKLNDSRFATRYLVGDGIDIGSGDDPLLLYHEFFPLMRSCTPWDLPDGDAELLATVDDNIYDFVYSSHCLEHLHDPHVAINNWLRVLKPGGHMICTIPDEDLYEQGVFPSTFNSDHKNTFTIFKKNSWSPKSVNVLDLISQCKYDIDVKKIELLDATYRYKIDRLLTDSKRFDQTSTPIGECAIEFILEKKK